MKKIAYEYSRIKNVLIKDKNNKNDKMNNVIKAEIFDVLSNYMEVEGLDCFVGLDEYGKWQIKVVAKASNFYTLKSSF